MQSIIVCATTHRTEWLKNCLDSFRGYNAYPILTVMVNEGRGYIPDFLRTIVQFNIDEFVLLQDSMEIKDTSLFDICFQQYKGISVSLSRTPTLFGSTHGKFLTNLVRECDIPQLSTKYEDALYEVSFGQEYARKCGDNLVDLCDLEHTGNFAEKFWRNNMVVENQYIRKFKGTWTLDMAKIVK